MPSTNIGTVLNCPTCGHEFRRKYIVVSKYNDARADLARALALLKLIAETPEPKDTIQVWAWQAYKREVPDAQ